MRIHSLQSWVEEKKDINNNLAVPLYRSFCKTYGLNFHFGGEIKDSDHNKHSTIILKEITLHGKALSLFNSVNKPYYPFRGGFVSFSYISWDDFDYENLTPEEVAHEMGNKDIAIEKLRNESAFYAVIALFSSLPLSVLITLRITNSNVLPTLVLLVNFVLILVAPQFIHKIRKRVEQRRFNQKLSELREELKSVSTK